MANGQKPKQEVIPAHTGLPNLDQLTAKEREQFMRAFSAGIGAAAAMQVAESEMNTKEFMGIAPNDFRREFSPLPKPAHGGSRRPSQRPNNGHTGTSTRQ